MKLSKLISHYKNNGYNINVLRQTACLVVNPITVDIFAFLFNCKPASWTSDCMTLRLKDLSIDERAGPDAVSLVRHTGV